MEGAARIVATDNGDLSSSELHTDTDRSLYQGEALVVLRAGHTASSVTLTVEGEVIKKQSIKFITQ